MQKKEVKTEAAWVRCPVCKHTVLGYKIVGSTDWTFNSVGSSPESRAPGSACPSHEGQTYYTLNEGLSAYGAIMGLAYRYYEKYKKTGSRHRLFPIPWDLLQNPEEWKELIK